MKFLVFGTMAPFSFLLLDVLTVLAKSEFSATFMENE